jgi:putative transposase
MASCTTATPAAKQYTSIRYAGRLADAGALASIGTVGDSYDNAMAESVIGLYKAECVRRKGPVRTVDDLELRTLTWVHWSNRTPVHSALDHFPGPVLSNGGSLRVLCGRNDAGLPTRTGPLQDSHKGNSERIGPPDSRRPDPGPDPACILSAVPESRDPDELLHEFFVTGIPVSAQAKRRDRLKQWREDVRASAAKEWTGTAPMEGEFAVIIVLYADGWRLDVDNMAKPILDALTGLLWNDDRQVVQALPAYRELFGTYRVTDVSETLYRGFATNRPFVHVQVRTPPDKGIPL